MLDNNLISCLQVLLDLAAPPSDGPYSYTLEDAAIIFESFEYPDSCKAFWESAANDPILEKPGHCNIHGTIGPGDDCDKQQAALCGQMPSELPLVASNWFDGPYHAKSPPVPLNPCDPSIILAIPRHLRL